MLINSRVGSKDYKSAIKSHPRLQEGELFWHQRSAFHRLFWGIGSTSGDLIVFLGFDVKKFGTFFEMQHEV